MASGERSPQGADLWAQALAQHRSGRLAEAIDLYGRLIDLGEGDGAAFANRGAAWLGLGQAPRALEDLDQALALQPDQAANHSNRAVALRRLGRAEDALSSLDAAIALQPDLADAWANRGEVLNALGRHEDALASVDRSLALRPGHAQALTSRAVSLLALERPQDAAESASLALSIAPRHADARYALGLAFSALGRPGDAVVQYDAALILNPQLVDAQLQRGNARFALAQFGDALADFAQVAAARPQSSQAHYNHGKALTELDRPEEALAAYDRALALSPDDAKAHNNRGAALTALRRPAEAAVAYERSMALAPDFATAFANRAMAALSLGDFATGWRLAEWRKRTPEQFGAWDGRQPGWTGNEDLDGKTLLVHAEQGLGDTLQFVRYLPMLTPRAAKVILVCQKPLVALLTEITPGVEVIGEGEPMPGFDFQIALLSLPFALGSTGQDDIPAATPYLQAEPARVARWRQKIGDQGFKVGVSWRSSRLGASIGKSFPLTALAPLAALPGIRLISLQKGEGSEEIAPALAGLPIESLGAEFDSGPDAFLDSAAVMQSLDLVITVDTALAHLAGALDRPVWVALKHAADWRWLLERSDTPWYPSMRLFRQLRRDQWTDVIDAMRRALEQEVGLRA